MNIGMTWESAIRNAPGGAWIADSVKAIVTAVTGGYHTEHNPDDTHGIIHATGAIYERKRDKLATPVRAAMGEWVYPFFVPTDFFSPAGTAWTVAAAQVRTYGYTLVGMTMTVAFDIQSTTVAGGPAALQIAIPNGWFAAKQANNMIHIADNGALAVGFAQVTANARAINLWRNDLVAWAVAAGTTSVRGQITFEVRTA